LAEAEAAVTEGEARVSGIRARLEDPGLYATAEGAVQARTLGQELEMARTELERSFAEWEAATLALEKAGHG
jgi:hypothetical protein